MVAVIVEVKRAEVVAVGEEVREAKFVVCWVEIGLQKLKVRILSKHALAL